MSFSTAKLLAEQGHTEWTHQIGSVAAPQSVPSSLRHARQHVEERLQQSIGRSRKGAKGDAKGSGQSTLGFAPAANLTSPKPSAVACHTNAIDVSDSEDECSTLDQQPLVLSALMVGRHFHREGNAALLEQGGETLHLCIEREPRNPHDPNALLLRVGTGLRSCGHLPREFARVLSPLLDDGIVASLAAEATTAELLAFSEVTLRAAPVRLLVHFASGCPAPARLSVAALAAAGPMAAVARPRRGDNDSVAKRTRPATQQSLLMNFGRGCSFRGGTLPSACLPSIIAGGHLFSIVMEQLNVVALFRMRWVDRHFRAAIDNAGHLTYRAAIERLLVGHSVAAPPYVDDRFQTALAAAATWASGCLRTDTVLEAICIDELGTLPQRLAGQLPENAGWQLLAGTIWTAPAKTRLALFRAALRCDEIRMDALRELVALLAMHALPSKLSHKEGRSLGDWRHYSDLLACNRLLESAGLKLPLPGLRIPSLRLTEEQEGIVSRLLKPTELLVISAFAGTGKTSTLRMYAMLRPHLKFLYICFNVSVREEAQRSFPSNVTCKNVHQLAFAGVGHRFKHKLRGDLRAEELLSSPLLDRLIQPSHACKEDTHRLECAVLCVNILQAYWNSAASHICEEHLPSPTTSLRKDDRLPEANILEVVRELWCQMCDTSNINVRMTHSGYLKLYSLSHPRLKSDVIMLDEAQDCNPAIGAIVVQQPCARILVGDEHQAIYGFLGAQDMLSARQLRTSGSSVGSVVRRQLTRSFRFGANIADAANFLLATWKAERRPLLGCSPHLGDVISEGIKDAALMELASREHVAYVARSNTSIFLQAIQADSAGLTLEWVGGVAGYQLDFLKDLCRLAISDSDPREREHIETGRIKSFRSFSAAKSFAKRIDDREFIARVGLVQQHHPELLLATFERLQVMAQRRERSSQPLPAHMVLTTVHKAKGLEWDNVVIADDFLQLSQTGSNDVDLQELNMLYVAVTRAKKKLFLCREIGVLYGPRSEAVALACADAALWGSCPFCGTDISALRNPRSLASELVLVGSASLRRSCSACVAHADTGVRALVQT